jgi:hypothetical protein
MSALTVTSCTSIHKTTSVRTVKIYDTAKETNISSESCYPPPVVSINEQNYAFLLNHCFKPFYKPQDITNTKNIIARDSNGNTYSIQSMKVYPTNGEDIMAFKLSSNYKGLTYTTIDSSSINSDQPLNRVPLILQLTDKDISLSRVTYTQRSVNKENTSKVVANVSRPNFVCLGQSNAPIVLEANKVKIIGLLSKINAPWSIWDKDKQAYLQCGKEVTSIVKIPLVN